MQTLYFASRFDLSAADFAPESALLAPGLETHLETPAEMRSDCGMPADRAARLAARKAFVEMKQIFIRAVEPLPAAKGAWLRQQVRAATDPMDLWLLRGPVLAALFQDDRSTRDLRAAIYRGLDDLFPDSQLDTPVDSLLEEPALAPPPPWAQAAPEGERRASYR
jgi:hypothetical protein